MQSTDPLADIRPHLRPLKSGQEIGITLTGRGGARIQIPITLEGPHHSIDLLLRRVVKSSVLRRQKPVEGIAHDLQQIAISAYAAAARTLRDTINSAPRIMSSDRVRNALQRHLDNHEQDTPPLAPERSLLHPLLEHVRHQLPSGTQLSKAGLVIPRKLQVEDLDGLHDVRIAWKAMFSGIWHPDFPEGFDEYLASLIDKKVPRNQAKLQKRLNTLRREIRTYGESIDATRDLIKQVQSDIRFQDICSTKPAAVKRLKTRLREQVALERVSQIQHRFRERWGDLRLSSMYPVARQLDRRLTFFVGPTNSGKTHQAFQRLAAGRSGVYLAPLRLLALEGRDRLEAMAIPTHLITGEEREICKGARFTASTMEMLDTSQPVDTIVIDEIQMLGDHDRGWAWVQALVGAPANEIIMTGSPDALDAARHLADYLGEPLEIIECTRFNELRVNDTPSNPSVLSPGTALIAFSRRDVLAWKEELERKGRSVAVIYGALGPGVRREEARRFRDGEADILVATDAIAMGLNLPIREVIFSTHIKWNGRKEVELDNALILQIAGRSGRYGLQETGSVGALSGNTLQAVRTAFDQSKDPRPVSGPFPILPTPEQIGMLAETLGTKSVAEVLVFYREYLAAAEEQTFRCAQMDELLALAFQVDRFPRVPITIRHAFALAPVNQRSPSVQAAWETFFMAYRTRKALPAPRTPFKADGATRDNGELQRAEDSAHTLTLYRWLGYRFPEVFCQMDEANRTLGQVNQFIMNSLLQGVIRLNG